jgi:hypothetical protein
LNLIFSIVHGISMLNGRFLLAKTSACAHFFLKLFPVPIQCAGTLFMCFSASGGLPTCVQTPT